MDPRSPRGGLRPCLVFALAFAVRLLSVGQVRRSPYFDVPLIDGPNYFRMAAAIAGGSLAAGHQVFWQPPLYPYFRALLFVRIGTRMAGIYATQAAVGAFSCVLTYLTGRRVFGERAACGAAWVMALYGPLIHFDAQPLIPVLHIVLVLAGLLMLLRAAGIGGPAPEEGASPPRPSRGGFFGAGVLWGLAATATPNILLSVPVAAWWTWRRMRPA